MSSTSRTALFVAALAGIAGWLVLRATASHRPDPDSPATSTESTPSESPLAAPAQIPGSKGDVVEQMIPLDAKLEVELVEVKSKAPVVGAEVRAALYFRAPGSATEALELWRTEKTGADGVATFDGAPRLKSVDIRVGNDGYRTQSRFVSLDRTETTKRIRFEMTPGLPPEKSAVRLLPPAGTALPGLGVRYLDRTNGGAGLASPEAGIYLDDDPDAPAEHDVELQLILPGYAGDRFMRRLRRGTSLTLEAPKGERVSQEIALLDEDGRGVEALAVSVWPTASTGSSVRFTELAGATDARGVVVLEGHRGIEWRLDADATRVVLPDRSDEHPFAVGSVRPTFHVGRRVSHRLLFDGKGLETKGRAELIWKSYEPKPGSTLEKLFRDEPARYADRIRRYVERLPRAVDWERLASGGLAAEIGLLPGSYVLSASTDQLFGRETTLDVGGPGEETVVPLAPSITIRVKVEGSFDRSGGPLPYRTMVLAHRAGWDERAEILRVLGESWRASAVRGPPPRVSDFDAAHLARMEQTSLELARRQAPLIGRDLGYVGADGVAVLEAAEAPRGVTVFFPGRAVAYVPVDGDGKSFRGRVEPSDFRRLAIRVRRADARAFPGYPVAPAPLAHLLAGVTELGAKQPTDGEGVLRVGVLPNERVGLDPGLDAWTVSPGAGTSIERLDTGYTPSFVVTIRADVAEPSIEVVAEPFESK